MDDAIVWTTSVNGMQAAICKCLKSLHAMKAKSTVAKFGLPHDMYDKHRIMPKHTMLEVEGTRVKAATKTQYVKFLGGNANVLASCVEDIAGIRKHACHITS